MLLFIVFFLWILELFVGSLSSRDKHPLNHGSQLFVSERRNNLWQFALITERIPIIPKFLSNHIDPSAPPF
ncbi:hypothetical protein EV424DRAFT_1461477 [Suillus variegatus]|nr:hypothetical protein EV424DRAFT_1461477 [Suillus variegatus]